MKTYTLFFVGISACLIAAGETLAAPAGGARGRASTVASVGGAVKPAGRLATLPMPRNVPIASQTDGTNGTSGSSTTGNTDVDLREQEKLACQSNNVGVGNTFVWASRYSDIGDYSSMVEDMDNPENNVCFVRIEIKSNDSRINVSDMGGKYFELGSNITCGGWLDESKLEKRILDAKKSARTWATVGGAVGGAGVGVGIMEIGGNKLLASAGVDSVQGQKALSGYDLIASQLKTFSSSDRDKYNKLRGALQTIKDECKKSGAEDNAYCTEYAKYDLDELLGI